MAYKQDLNQNEINALLNRASHKIDGAIIELEQVIAEGRIEFKPILRKLKTLSKELEKMP